MRFYWLKLYLKISTIQLSCWWSWSVDNQIITNYLREGLLIDYYYKLSLKWWLLNWIIKGSQILNFTLINRSIYTYYYNNFFLLWFWWNNESIQMNYLIILFKMGWLLYVHYLILGFSFYILIY